MPTAAAHSVNQLGSTYPLLNFKRSFEVMVPVSPSSICSFLSSTSKPATSRAANSIKFYSSSTYFSKFEFFNLIIYEFDKNELFRVQADEYPKSRQLFTADARAIKKIKIIRSCSRFNSISQL